MEAIGDLNGFRCAARGTLGIEARSIPTDHHDSGMRLQPSGQAIGETMGQKTPGNMFVGADQDGPVLLPFAPPPLVDANRHSSFYGWYRTRLYSPQDSITTGLHAE